MDYKKIFFAQLKEDFIPLIRNIGFKGSGQNFRRIKNEIIHTINIQGNKYGGSCCVNLGLHTTFLPLCWDPSKLPDVKTIKEVDCEFSLRLAPSGKHDYWWKYSGNGLLGNTSKSIIHLISTFNEVGQSYFDHYSSIESIIQQLSIEDLSSSDYLNKLGGVIPIRGALTMARIYKYLGDKNKQREYALWGLKNLGNATALKDELEQLANKT